ncbi:MAG TPA: alpha/beta hydrolase [Gammaproteobacteria bacterium]|nr:alpha/beta hydrolase [Gammaproteobacteria bacterium]
MSERRLAVIDVKPGASMESQSGLQALRPRIYGAYEEPTAGSERVAAIVMHPTSNFMGHYLISPLAQRGICCMGLNSRYVGNDSMLIMERVIQDLGAGVRFLRERGYERVFLLGNSGGGALVAFYQAQAENLTVHETPAGDPTGLSPADLPAADGIVLLAAHAGRASILREWIDPSVIDESDNLGTDPELDVYNPANGPPFSDEFLKRFRTAQVRRLTGIENWVRGRLDMLRDDPRGPADQAFVIYRTHADPRFLDLRLDANDREIGGIWGDPRQVNSGANAMGRFTSLTAFLSQWSSASNADGPRNLARTSVPVLFFEHTADSSTFPSTRAAWLDAAGRRATAHRLVGGTHYLTGQPELIEQMADLIAESIA